MSICENNNILVLSTYLNCCPWRAGLGYFCEKCSVQDSWYLSISVIWGSRLILFHIYSGHFQCSKHLLPLFQNKRGKSPYVVPISLSNIFVSMSFHRYGTSFTSQNAQSEVLRLQIYIQYIWLEVGCKAKSGMPANLNSKLFTVTLMLTKYCHGTSNIHLGEKLSFSKASK